LFANAGAKLIVLICHKRSCVGAGMKFTPMIQVGFRMTEVKLEVFRECTQVSVGADLGFI
jgi:hypothetical protein